MAQKDFFKNLENLVVFSVIVLNQTYNLKNSSDPNFQSKNDSAMSDYAEMLTNYTLSRSKGLNPTTISELTGVTLLAASLDRRSVFSLSVRCDTVLGKVFSSLGVGLRKRLHTLDVGILTARR